jgi:hypothetical protein
MKSKAIKVCTTLALVAGMLVAPSAAFAADSGTKGPIGKRHPYNWSCLFYVGSPACRP